MVKKLIFALIFATLRIPYKANFYSQNMTDIMDISIYTTNVHHYSI